MYREMDAELYPWLMGIVCGQPAVAGSFLRSVAETAVRADTENYAILRPALLSLKAKYPGYRCEATALLFSSSHGVVEKSCDGSLAGLRTDDGE